MKHENRQKQTENRLVVPYIGTWIETKENEQGSAVVLVVPYIGTWIETDVVKSIDPTERVVPYIGTWIETC